MAYSGLEYRDGNSTKKNQYCWSIVESEAIRWFDGPSQKISHFGYWWRRREIVVY